MNLLYKYIKVFLIRYKVFLMFKYLLLEKGYYSILCYNSLALSLLNKKV